MKKNKEIVIKITLVDSIKILGSLWMMLNGCQEGDATNGNA